MHRRERDLERNARAADVGDALDQRRPGGREQCSPASTGYVDRPGVRRAARPPRQGVPRRAGAEPDRRPARGDRGDERGARLDHRRRHDRARRARRPPAGGQRLHGDPHPRRRHRRQRADVRRGADRSAPAAARPRRRSRSWPCRDGRASAPLGANVRALLAEAIAMGVDLVGGAPHLEEDVHAANEQMLGDRRRAGLGLDLHTDETLDAGVCGLADLAERVLATGFPHRGDGQPLRQPRRAARGPPARGRRARRRGRHPRRRPPADEPVPPGPRRAVVGAPRAHRGARPCARPASTSPPGRTTCRTRSTRWAAVIRWRRRA